MDNAAVVTGASSGIGKAISQSKLRSSLWMRPISVFLKKTHIQELMVGINRNIYLQ